MSLYYSDDPRAEHLTLNAARIGVPVDAILFIHDAAYLAPQYEGEEPGTLESEPRHVSPAELCRTIPRYARDLWGADWRDALRHMTLYSGDDVGRVVRGMIREGLLTASEDDDLGDFVGSDHFVSPA